MSSLSNYSFRLLFYNPNIIKVIPTKALGNVFHLVEKVVRDKVQKACCIDAVNRFVWFFYAFKTQIGSVPLLTKEEGYTSKSFPQSGGSVCVNIGAGPTETNTKSDRSSSILYTLHREGGIFNKIFGILGETLAFIRHSEAQRSEVQHQSCRGSQTYPFR